MAEGYVVVSTFLQGYDSVLYHIKKAAYIWTRSMW